LSLKVVVLAVGKLRDRSFAALCDDYVARARRHLGVEVVEVEDDAALARKWPAQGETIALEGAGEAWTTERFARHLGERVLDRRRRRSAGGAGGAGQPAPVAVRHDAAAPDGAPRLAGTDLPRPLDHPRGAISSLVAPRGSGNWC